MPSDALGAVLPQARRAERLFRELTAAVAQQGQVRAPCRRTRTDLKCQPLLEVPVMPAPPPTAKVSTPPLQPFNLRQPERAEPEPPPTVARPRLCAPSLGQVQHSVSHQAYPPQARLRVTVHVLVHQEANKSLVKSHRVSLVRTARARLRRTFLGRVSRPDKVMPLQSGRDSDLSYRSTSSKRRTT